MAKFRSDPPKTLGDLDIVSVRDYASNQRMFTDGKTESIDGPTGDLVIFETDRARQLCRGTTIGHRTQD